VHYLKKPINDVRIEFESKNISIFKQALTDLCVSQIVPIGQQIQKYLLDEPYLTSVLQKGANKAQILAQKNLKIIKQQIGFI